MTTYDKVWESFLNKCKIDDLEIPNTDSSIHQTIQNAILSFNNKLTDDLSGDDTTETLSRELDGNELLVLSHCIRFIILENQLIYFSSTYTPFTKELGVRNVGNQMGRLEKLVENEDKKIDGMIMKMVEDF